MKVLLTNTYFYPLDSKQWGFKKPYPPLGTIQLAAQLKEQGYDILFFDNCLNDDPKKIESAIKDFGPEVLLIYDDGFNYLTKMCLTVMRECAYAMASTAKKSGITTIISSSDSSDRFEQYLDNDFDFVIMGEGDVTASNVLQKLNDGQDPKEVDGLKFIDESSEIVSTPKRAILRDLDSLPIAAWDLVDLESYKKIWMSHHGYFSLNIATTRGCPYKCNWCAKPIYGNRYNTRTPEHVTQEIELLVNHYKVDHFWMCDDIFGLKPNWVQEFDKILKDQNLRFKYMIQSRVDLLLKDDTIDALASSGLETVWLGAESGSQKVLDAMDKGISVDQIYEAVPKLQKSGIRVALFLQFGYLGETMDDIQETIKMVLKLMPEDVGISVSYPLPGTKFYEKVKDDIQAKANWVDSDDLDLMFQNTYPSGFYKRLHRYVHNKHKLKRGLKALQKTVSMKEPTNAKQLKYILATGYHFPMAIINGRKVKKLAKLKS